MPIGYKRDGTPLGFRKGYKMSHETKDKIREARRKSQYIITEKHRKQLEWLHERNKGTKRSKETRNLMRNLRLGMKFSKEHRENISKACRETPLNKGENHHGWNPDRESYEVLHHRLCKEVSKPDHCDRCQKIEQIKLDGSTARRNYFQWANITGVYTIDIRNWMQLCISCHTKEDHANPKKPEQYYAGRQAGKNAGYSA